MVTLPTLIARRFIATPHVHALQAKSGAWYPAREYNPATGKHDGPDLPFTKQVIEDHLAKKKTVGHYLINQDNNCKLFAFDLDLVNHDTDWISYPSDKDIASLEMKFGDDRDRMQIAWEHLMRINRQTGNPRELWQDKQHRSRPYLMRQMRGLAEMLSQRIHKELEIPVAVAYSGNKGLHVYGFTGMLPAADARALALEILDSFDRFTSVKGRNFFADTDTDPETGYPTLEIEVFPKQDTVNAYGNLMALPLGMNQKAPNSRKFFVDQRSPQSTIVPHNDPETVLEGGDPWH